MYSYWRIRYPLLAFIAPKSFYSSMKHIFPPTKIYNDRFETILATWKIIVLQRYILYGSWCSENSLINIHIFRRLLHVPVRKQKEPSHNQSIMYSMVGLSIIQLLARFKKVKAVNVNAIKELKWRNGIWHISEWWYIIYHLINELHELHVIINFTCRSKSQVCSNNSLLNSHGDCIYNGSYRPY